MLTRSILYKATVFLSLLLSTVNASAADAPTYSSMDSPLAIFLVVIAGLLLLVIGMLAVVLSGAADVFMQKLKDGSSKGSDVVTKIAVAASLLLVSSGLFAQEPTTVQTAVVASSSRPVLSDLSFYSLVTVISLELLVIIVMASFVKKLLAKEKPSKAPVPARFTAEKWKAIWDKLNSFRPQHQEKEILLDHDYDGIRELDNRLPQWWKWSFYLSIVFAVIYLYRFHVVHTGPSSIDEFKVAMIQADEQRTAYLAKAASQVDENSVGMITDETSLEEGRSMFLNACAACHGAEGQGGVGPNLTDDYWLHKGSINDIFSTIKYGYPEKGMKSWKDDFSPVQIAKISSYIKTLAGTNPVNPKEPQGELYKDADTPTKDSKNLPQKKHDELSNGITKK